MKRWWIVMVLGSPSLAQAGEDAFFIDPALVQNVYQQSRDEVHNHPTSWTVAAEFGVLNTAPLVVNSDLYNVDYAANRKYLPTGAVSIGREFWRTEHMAGEIDLQTGFSSYRDTVKARSVNGIDVEDNLVLQVIPVRLRHVLRIAAIEFAGIEPKVLVEAGQTWVHQSGTLDGMETSEWRGSVGAGLGADLFADPDAGFGGLSITSVMSRRPEQATGWTHLIGSRLVL